eukprot:SAG31_NODE_22504_length_524_cov_0.849412_1_plen_138_part_01
MGEAMGCVRNAPRDGGQWVHCGLCEQLQQACATLKPCTVSINTNSGFVAPGPSFETESTDARTHPEERHWRQIMTSDVVMKVGLRSKLTGRSERYGWRSQALVGKLFATQQLLINNCSRDLEHLETAYNSMLQALYAV